MSSQAKAAPATTASRGRFKTSEWVLLALSLAVTTGAALIYSTGYPIRNWLFGLESDQVDRPIGKVGAAGGTLRRQLRRNPEFKAIPPEETLYNRDTVVTGPDSTATLEISDAGSIELGPNTMVRLVFAEQTSIGGASRAPVVDVIQGSVTGRAQAAPLLLRNKGTIKRIERNSDEKVTAPKPEPVKKVARVELPPMPSIASLPPPASLPAAPPIAAPEVAAPPVAPVISNAPIKVTRTLAATYEPSASANAPVIPLDLAWSGGNPSAPLRLEILKEGSNEPIQSQLVQAGGDGKSSWQGEINQAGAFSWRLVREDGSPALSDQGSPVQGQFAIKPEWKKLSPLKPLVGGQEKDNNDFEGGSLKRSPAITFRWKSLVPQELAVLINQTRIRVWDAANPKNLLMDQKLKGTEVEFSKDRLYLGKLVWQASAPTSDGFVATTGPQEFQVKFNPPNMVEPAQEAIFSRSKMSRSSDGSVLLTWKKTLFTDNYEVEVAEDENFSKVIWKARPKENYALFRSGKNQSFWWRVKSSNATGSSSFNAGRKFSLAP